MRLFSVLPAALALLRATTAAPIVSETAVTQKVEAAPAVDKLGSLVSKFVTLISIINELPSSDPNVAPTITSLIPSMLSDFNAATQLTATGGDIDISTALGYVAAALPLTFQVRQLATALKDHKKDIEALGLRPAMAQFANDADALMRQFSDAYLAKLTAVFLLPANIWLDDFKTQFDALAQVFAYGPLPGSVPLPQTYTPQPAYAQPSVYLQPAGYAQQQPAYAPQSGYQQSPTYTPSGYKY